jgi:predicted metal-dependent phosphoesterase TrpH
MMDNFNDVYKEHFFHEFPVDFYYNKLTIAYDLHIHSCFSDGRSTPEMIVKKAENMGIGVAITDHNEIGGSLIAYEKELCPVIPAIEVASREGVDTLVYFTKPENLELFYKNIVEKNKTANPHSLTRIHALDILKEAKNHEGFSVLAHPYGIAWKNWSKLINKSGKNIRSLVAGIECFNAAMPWGRNLKAFRLAHQWNKAMIGGSDAHIHQTVGDVVTLFQDVSNTPLEKAFSFRDAKIVGKRSRFKPRILSHCSMTLQHMPFWASVAKQHIWHIKHKIKGRN